MARMIPAVIPEDTQSQAEKKLFPILKESLNDGFTIFHSFSLLTHNMRDNVARMTRREGSVRRTLRGFLAARVR
jgi:hypothetical protein